VKGYFVDLPPFNRLAANLSLLYPDLAFAERFGACAEDGFQAVEILFPYDIPAAQIARALRSHGLQLVLINTPPGDVAAGDRGLLGQPGRQGAFREALAQAMEVACATGCQRIHLMMGCADREHHEATGAALQARQAVIVENLQHASSELKKAGMVGLLEPINTRDIPGYLLNRQEDALTLLDAVGSDSLALQMDLYHCQIVQGDVTTRLRQNIDRIGHIQIAGVPNRNEPGEGELDHGHVFGVLAELGYQGWIGCEYRPSDTTAGGTSRGLSWLRKVLPHPQPQQGR
jgi:hydroxypyruvate isomerase